MAVTNKGERLGLERGGRKNHSKRVEKKKKGGK